MQSVCEQRAVRTGAQLRAAMRNRLLKRGDFSAR
jgi:hypothetical protein